jgi:ribose-phosphate pyrophosphokinase
MFDDIVDSAGTLCNAAAAMMDKGAASVSAYVAHGVMSGGAFERVDASALKELVVSQIQSTTATNSRSPAKCAASLLHPLIGEAIRRIANEESVSKLFD